MAGPSPNQEAWRSRGTLLRLEGETCSDCNEKIFPPHGTCPNCSSQNKEPYTFSGEGEVYSYTTLFEAAEGFEHLTPYTVALIKLSEGPLITTQITDSDNGEVQIGDPVELVTRKLKEDGPRGQITYGYAARPPIARKLSLES